MKRVLSILLSVAMLCGMCVVPVGAGEFDIDNEYLTAMNEAFENNYERWYDGYSLTDGDCQLATYMLNSVWGDIKLTDEEVEQIHKYYQLEGLYCVYNKELLEEVIKYKFNLSVSDIAQKANKDLPNSIIQKDDYWMVRSYGRGEAWPGSSMVVDSFEKLNSNTVYAKWHFENSYDDYSERSYDIYAILEKGTVAGKEIVGYRYVGITPPSEDILEQYGYSKTDISVIINGNNMHFDQQPIMYNNRTFVPMRAIFEAMGAKVMWTDATQTITAAKDGTTIRLNIGDYAMYKNGKRIDMDVPAMLVNGTTLVPVRAVSEAFSCDVNWDDKTKTVEISYAQKDNTVAEALTQFAKDNLQTLYEDDYARKYTYTDVRFLLADMSGDDEPELIAIGVDGNEMQYYEIYSYENGKAINIEKNYFGYAHGGAMHLLWYENGVRLGAESGSSGTGFLMRLMKYQNGDWVDVYNSHVDFDFTDDSELKGYLVNGEYVSEEEFDASREEIAGYNVDITDFIILEVFNCDVNGNSDITEVEVNTKKNDSIAPAQKNENGKYYFFSFFDDYNDITYAVDWLGTNGARHPCYGNVQPNSLPGAIQDVVNEYGQLWSFVIYNNRFYCLIGGGASVYALASIYSFDMNGNDMKLITDDAMNYSTCYIYNNELYYSAWCTKYFEDDNYDEVFDRYYDGGVYKVNLDSQNKLKVANESEIEEYFSNTIYKNFKGSKIKELSFGVAISPDCKYMYYTDYDKAKGGHPIYYFDSINQDENYVLMEEKTFAISVRDKYLYYTNEEENNRNGYDAHVYRIPRPDLVQEKTDIQLTLNGKSISLKDPPVMQNESVMIPMREICEKIGATVIWDNNAQTATAVYKEITAKFIAGKDKIYVNGLERNIDVAVQFINDLIYIPVRALTEAFNDNVSWEEPNTVRINHYGTRSITVYLDNKKISIPTAMSGDVPVVAAEDLCKQLKFVYNKVNENMITMQNGERVVTITEGVRQWQSKGIFYSGMSIANDLGGIPYIQNGKMMIPTHNVCEYLGSKEYQHSYLFENASYEIYLFKPEVKTPTYTSSEEYNRYIYEQIKVDTSYTFAEDYDNDGNDEAFVFYKKKSSNKLSCSFFDFEENKYTNKKVFDEESFGDLSFYMEDVDGQKVLVMCSDNDFLRLYYGFSVTNGEYVHKAMYGIANTPNYNWYNDLYHRNDYINSDKYDYLNQEDNDYINSHAELDWSVPKVEGTYWGLDLMEVSPDFIKTFENGDKIYETCIDKYLKAGDKVQVLYAPNNTIYINYKHYDTKNNRIENKYKILWIGNEVKNKLSSGGSGYGNYPKGVWWWWAPPIIAKEDDIAYQYKCDTEEYFEDNSTWKNDIEIGGIKDLLIFFNGQKLKLTHEIQMENDRIMYPFRECMEFMGAKVEWNPSLQEVSAELNGNKVVFKINSKRYTVNGAEKEMDVSSYIDTDATYIPIRYAAEALGYTVDWIPSFENNVISIGDNSVVGNEIENYISGYNNLTDTAKIGKGIYDLMKNNHKKQFEEMRLLQFTCKNSIEECARAQDCQNSILDVATLTVDATIALARTYSGDAKAGVDFIASQVTGKTAGYIGGAIGDSLEFTSMDEIVKSMCNSAFDNNLALIDAMENYYNQFNGKMNNETYINFLLLYQCIRQNNRTLKMGVEYFSEDLSENLLKNLEKATRKVADSLMKDIVMDSAENKIADALGIKVSDDLFSAFSNARLDYKIAKELLENRIGDIYSSFKNAGSPALKSYGEDMEKINKDFWNMCLK